MSISIQGRVSAALPLCLALITGGSADAASFLPGDARATHWSLANGDVFTYATRETSRDCSIPCTNPVKNVRTSTDVDTVTFPVKHGDKSVYQLTDTVVDTSDPLTSQAKIAFGFERLGGGVGAPLLAEYGWQYVSSGSIPSGTARKEYNSPLYQRFFYPPAAMNWNDDVSTSGASSYMLLFGATITLAFQTTYEGVSFAEYSGGSDRLVNNNYTGVQDETLFGIGDALFGSPVLRNSAMVIPVTQQGSVNYVPLWFTELGEFPVNDDVTETPSVTTPGSCGIQSSKSTYEVAETFYDIDPVNGSITTASTESYGDSSHGLICAIQSVTLRKYDNLQSGVLEERSDSTTTSVLTSETLAAGQGPLVAAIPRNLVLVPPSSLTFLDPLHNM